VNNVTEIIIVLIAQIVKTPVYRQAGLPAGRQG